MRGDPGRKVAGVRTGGEAVAGDRQPPAGRPRDGDGMMGALDRIEAPEKHQRRVGPDGGTAGIARDVDAVEDRSPPSRC